ncbi:MAG TPA: ribosome recycling factor [Candidatus Eisenbacteria bacterium]|jgi:ribosome recycling factor|nr:ribosome recycling factor [Candidatus Eisenbacteria bacterium]
MVSQFLKQAEERMKKSVETIRHEVATVRTNRATTALLDGIKVEYYGNPVPLQQVASISVPESRMLVIQPWERTILGEIVKAIQKSDLGLNPADDGTVVRLTLPTLTEERRKDLVKHLGKLIEDGRVRVRTVRRECNDELKKLEREHKVSEDDSKKSQAEIQKLHDRYIALLDELFQKKQAEVMEV